MMSSSSRHRASSGLTLLTVLLAACAREAQDPPGAAAQSSSSDVLEACAIVPANALSQVLGGSVTGSGSVNEMGDGWFSNCWFSGEERAFVTLNGSFRVATTSDELIATLGSWMDDTAARLGSDDVDPEASATLEPDASFEEPAARHFDGLMRMHVVTVQHGAYWVQVASPALETARDVARVFLEHAP